MSLESALKEIKQLKPFAEENTDLGPTSTMVGRRGRKAQAIDKIRSLKRDYTSDLIKSAVFIVVAGAQRNEFEKIATGPGFELFSSNPETFYTDLANRVHPSLYQGRASPSNLFDVLGRHLEDKMNELNINEYNQLIFKEKYISNTQGAVEFANLVKEAVNEQIGSEIVGIQAAYSIVDKAIEQEHSAKITPIVLTTSDEKLALSLSVDLERLTNRVYLVLAGKASKALKSVEDAIVLKEVTQETVKTTLDAIKSAIKR